MSEQSQGASSGPEGAGAGIDPTAMALALAGASRERADSFLVEQEALMAKSQFIAAAGHDLAAADRAALKDWGKRT